MTKPTQISAQRVGTEGAFTLLEMLLVLALIVVILGGLASLIRVFSNSYLADERRVSGAQLARSISQMLSDDLVAAVQDPIQAVSEDPSRQYIRHFGLRGDARSLQIDVVQPNLFVSTATAEENQRVLRGGDKTSDAKQVPELKTIFYEFVPINSVQEPDEKESSAATAGSGSGEDLGSSLSGSLSSSSSGLDGSAGASGDITGDVFPNPDLPLTQKYGLSRRELDYETPDKKTEGETGGQTSTPGAIDQTTGAAESTLAGSLTAPPDAANSQLAGGSQLNPLGGQEETAEEFYKPPMTAEQIAMDTDDGYVWAPEVLDCRFSYFDGTNWISSWDSIERDGLPIAIKVELKLAPLDDVDVYRQSPLLFALPKPPKLDDIAKLAADAAKQEPKSAADVSRLAGSLSEIASDVKPGQPVDVFNSYRPLEMIRAALTGVPTRRETLSSSEQIAVSSAATKTLEGETEAALGGFDSNPELELGGGFGTSAADPAAGGALGGAAQEPVDPDQAAMEATLQLAARGAVFNSAGICVDFSNDGSYKTLESLAEELGVVEPVVYEVVAYLPTTPMSRATTVERRRPAVTRAGRVSTRRNTASDDNSSRGRRERGQNPYATGRARQNRDRVITERTATERSARDRQASSRQVSERGAAARQTAERGENARVATQRGAIERGGAGNRRLVAREFTERLGANGGWTDEARGDAFDPITPGLGLDEAAPSAAPEPDAPAFAPQRDAAAAPEPGPLAGGLAGNGGATRVDSLDPFAIVDQQVGNVPFAAAGSEFDAIGGASEPGLIETPSGSTTVAAPTGTPRQANRQKSTWIRGN